MARPINSKSKTQGRKFFLTLINSDILFWQIAITYTGEHFFIAHYINGFLEKQERIKQKEALRLMQQYSKFNIQDLVDLKKLFENRTK